MKANRSNAWIEPEPILAEARQYENGYILVGWEKAVNHIFGTKSPGDPSTKADYDNVRTVMLEIPSDVRVSVWTYDSEFPMNRIGWDKLFLAEIPQTGCLFFIAFAQGCFGKIIFVV